MRQRAAESARPRVRRYVALGDSSSSSVSSDAAVPWPDLVAAGLGPGVRYLNLAAEGAATEDVEQRQLPQAIAFRPDLLSLFCGANDVLLSVRPDVDAYANRLSRILARIASEAPGVSVLTATYPDPTRFMALHERTGARLRRATQALNEATRLVSARHGALCLDWANHPAVFDRAHFAPDGFHPAPELHRRAAAFALDELSRSFEIDAEERAA